MVARPRHREEARVDEVRFIDWPGHRRSRGSTHVRGLGSWAFMHVGEFTSHEMHRRHHLRPAHSGSERFLHRRRTFGLDGFIS